MLIGSLSDKDFLFLFCFCRVKVNVEFTLYKTKKIYLYLNLLFTIIVFYKKEKKTLTFLNFLLQFAQVGILSFQVLLQLFLIFFFYYFIIYLLLSLHFWRSESRRGSPSPIPAERGCTKLKLIRRCGPSSRLSCIASACFPSSSCRLHRPGSVLTETGTTRLTTR